MNLLIDTCIIIDLLQKRDPFYQSAQKLIKFISNRKINGIITIKSLTDIYYLMRKHLHNEKEVRDIINNLYNIFDIKDTLSSDGFNALRSEIYDYEDAIMVETGKRLGVDYIITRNIKHYKNSEIPILTPEQSIDELNLEI